MPAVATLKPANDAESPDPKTVSPISRELVIGLVGFAGAGCSTVGKKLRAILHEAGYPDENIYPIKLSRLIESRFSPDDVPKVVEGSGEGASNTKSR